MSKAPKQHKNDNDDQDRADDPHTTVSVAVTVAAEPAAEATKQKNNEDDNENESKGHSRIFLCIYNAWFWLPRDIDWPFDRPGCTATAVC